MNYAAWYMDEQIFRKWTTNDCSGWYSTSTTQWFL